MASRTALTLLILASFPTSAGPLPDGETNKQAEDEGLGSDDISPRMPLPALKFNLSGTGAITAEATCSGCLVAVDVAQWQDANGQKRAVGEFRVELASGDVDRSTLFFGKELYSRTIALEVTATVLANDAVGEVARVLFVRIDENGNVHPATWSDYVCDDGIARCQGPANARLVFLDEEVVQ